MSDTGKLITPVQYERGLEGLNEIRPLVLDDTIRRVVSLPVLNSVSVNGSPVVKGKVLRCHNGAALGTLNRYYNAIQIQGWDEDETMNQYYEVKWSPPIKFILIEIILREAPSSFTFYDSTYTINCGNWKSVGIYYFPFVGDTMYMKTIALPAGHIEFNLYGFSLGEKRYVG